MLGDGHPRASALAPAGTTIPPELPASAGLRQLTHTSHSAAIGTARIRGQKGSVWSPVAGIAGDEIGHVRVRETLASTWVRPEPSPRGSLLARPVRRTPAC